MHRFLPSLISALTASLVSTGLGQESDAPLVSGPAAGSPLKAIACYAERGPLAGSEFDAAKHVGDAPAAFLFIHDLSRNTAPVIREFDRLGEDHAILGLKWFTIMLQGDRTEGENMLKRVNGSLKLHHPLVLSLDGLEGPGDYALNRRCTLTLVLAKDGKVTESIALTDTGPGDFPKLRGWVESVAGTVPESEDALRQLLQKRLPENDEALRRLAINQMLEIRKLRTRLAQNNARGRSGNNNMMRQRQARQERTRPDRPDGESQRKAEDPSKERKAPGATAKRQGKPPEDPSLNASLRAFIRTTNDDTRADEVYKQITERAAESDALTTEAVEMFKLMLSFRDRYGTAYAQGLAESFLKEHAAPASKKEE